MSLVNEIRTIEEDICYLQRDMEFRNNMDTVRELQRLQIQRQKLVNKKG